MKQTLLFICLFIWTVSSFGQIVATDLEVWGLPKGMSKDSFVNQLNEKQLKICMADIRPFGFKDANVIGMDNIYLVTLRPIPNHDFDKNSFKKIQEKAISKIQNAIDIDNLHSKEIQLAIRNVFAEQHNDTASINVNFEKAQPFDKNKYLLAINAFNRENKYSKNECIAALYFSKVDSIKEKALIAYIPKIKTNDDMLSLLPFLLDNNVDTYVANLLKNYFKYNSISKTEWNRYVKNFSHVLNSPSPTVCFFVTDILKQQKIPKEFKTEILKNGSVTIKEILQGQHSDIDFYKHKIFPFLTYVTYKDYENNAKKWLNYIDKVK
jgi:hypothetical protein